jgi:hypothetical protein
MLTEKNSSIEQMIKCENEFNLASVILTKLFDHKMSLTELYSQAKAKRRSMHAFNVSITTVKRLPTSFSQTALHPSNQPFEAHSLFAL